MKKITLTLFFTLGLFIFCNAQVYENDFESYAIGTAGNTVGFSISGGGQNIQSPTGTGNTSLRVLRTSRSILETAPNGFTSRTPWVAVVPGKSYIVTTRIVTINSSTDAPREDYILKMRLSTDGGSTEATGTFSPNAGSVTATNGVVSTSNLGQITNVIKDKWGTTSAVFTIPETPVDPLADPVTYIQYNRARFTIYQYSANKTDNFEWDNVSITEVPALSINDLSKFSFSSYPNPAKNYLNLSAAKSINKIEIYNLLGQNVLNKAINSSKSEVNVSNLSKGIYVARVFIENAVGSYKFIKE